MPSIDARLDDRGGIAFRPSRAVVGKYHGANHPPIHDLRHPFCRPWLSEVLRRLPAARRGFGRGDRCYLRRRVRRQEDKESMLFGFLHRARLV